MHLPIFHSHTLCWRFYDKDNHAINQILTKHNFHLCHRPVGNPSNPSSWRPVECLNDPIPTCFYFYLLWRLSTNGLLKLKTDKLRFNEAVWHIFIVFFFQCVWLSVCLKTLKTILNILFNFYYFIFFPEFAELVRISFLFLYLRFFYCKKKYKFYQFTWNKLCFCKYFCYLRILFLQFGRNMYTDTHVPLSFNQSCSASELISIR